MENSGHFATFDAVVSLLQDLELIMNSPSYVLGSDESFSSPFRKEDIQILFDKISSIHSSLCDSSGVSYDKELMDRWAHWIRHVVSLALEYIDSWVWSCAAQPKVEKESGTMSSPKLHRLAESMAFMNMQLKKIQDREEGLGQSSNSLQGATFTGQPFTVLDMWSITPKRGVPSARHYISRLLTYLPDAALSIGLPDAALSIGDDTTLCDNLRRIDYFLEDLQKKEGYDRKMIDSLESVIRFETRITEDITMSPWESVYAREDPITRRYFESGTTCLEGLNEITSFIHKQLKEIHDVRKILRNPISGPSFSFTNLNVFPRTFRLGNFRKYDAVISMLQDLERRFITEHYLPCPIKEGDIQFLYENLSLMNSSLDSSGKGYVKKLISALEMWIADVAGTAQYYLDAWVCSCLQKTNVGTPTDSGIYGAAQILNQNLSRITETLEFIHKQLERSHDNRQVLRLSNQNLLNKTSAGKLYIL